MDCIVINPLKTESFKAMWRIGSGVNMHAKKQGEVPKFIGEQVYGVKENSSHFLEKYFLDVLLEFAA